jgi:peroxisomal membrane protein 2
MDGRTEGEERADERRTRVGRTRARPSKAFSSIHPSFASIEIEIEIHNTQRHTNMMKAFQLLGLGLCLVDSTLAFYSPHVAAVGYTIKRTTKLEVSPVELWDSYNTALEASPLLVKSVTACVILGAADVMGQSLENLLQNKDVEEEEQIDKPLDVARVVRFAFFGLVLQAPWNHYYYNILDGQIPPTEDPFSGTNLAKVFIDQFIQAPVFTVLIFVFLGLLEGKSKEAISEQLDNDYQETLFANWKLWVPATAVNIAFVPPILRVLYLNCVFFFWSIYLSLQLNKKD